MVALEGGHSHLSQEWCAVSASSSRYPNTGREAVAERCEEKEV